jgi:uncharacterized protein (TIGR03437 family)
MRGLPLLLFASQAFSGTVQPAPADSAGYIYIAGEFYPGVPGLGSTPVTSRPPQPSNEGDTSLGFVTRLSPDGTTLSPAQLIPSSLNATGLAVRGDGSAVFVGSGPVFTAGVASQVLASVSLSSVGKIAAICDIADNAKIVSIAPGQLLTLYGTGLSGGAVTFNGIPAPILYTWDIQINLQVPYEVAGLTQVTMQVSPVSESYILAVVERQPSLFLSPGAFTQPIFDNAACNGQNIAGLEPLALNADGTQNSCANPAVSGSTVTIFLNGLGVTSPAQASGAISSSAAAITPAVSG